jgi:hypothetical protein
MIQFLLIVPVFFKFQISGFMTISGTLAPTGFFNVQSSMPALLKTEMKKRCVLYVAADLAYVYQADGLEKSIVQTT